MRIREGLGSVTTGLNRKQTNTPLPAYKVGKVFHVLLNENTPGKKYFDEKGGWGALGGIWFRDYNSSKGTNNEAIAPEDCKFAYPIFPNQKIFPLIGEIVLIFNLPSPDTQDNVVSNRNYYISVVSIWNSVSHNANAPTDTSVLGKTFFERSDVRPLQPYEGDIIYEGRDGNGIRLGGTTKDVNVPNPWSSTGGDNDPILILGNGYNFSSSLKPYVEDINKDKASLYLTSTQTIPLKVENVANPIVKPLDINKYNLGGQIIGNADRIVLSAKTDSILLHGKSNVGLYSKGPVTIDSTDSTIINSPKIILGLNKGVIPTEPVLLGNKTVEVLSTLIGSLNSFSTALMSAISTPQGTPITQITAASTSLATSLSELLRNIEDLKSQTTFTT